jgi:hypothetical protein
MNSAGERWIFQRFMTACHVPEKIYLTIRFNKGTSRQIRGCWETIRNF